MTPEDVDLVQRGHCPICLASDAVVQPQAHTGDVYVECLNCRVYVASRRAFRHFEYLRWRNEAAGLAKLAALARYLNERELTGAARLELDTWESLLGS